MSASKFTTLSRRVKIHSKGTPYQCSHCGQHFYENYKLERHLARHAQAQKEIFQCPECSESFSCKRHMVDHAMRRAGHGKFKCEFCLKNFVSKCALAVHMMSHKPDNFLCLVCGETFAMKKIMEMHLKTHTNLYPCSECPKRYAAASGLKQHMRMVHAGEVPNQCSESQQCLPDQQQVQQLGHMKDNYTSKSYPTPVHFGQGSATVSLTKDQSDREVVPVGTVPELASTVHVELTGCNVEVKQEVDGCTVADASEPYLQPLVSAEDVIDIVKEDI